MKKLLFILFIIPTISFAQSFGTYFWAKNYVKSPYYISGIDTLVQWNKRGTGAVFLGNVSIGTSTLGYGLNLKGDVKISIPNNVNGKIFSIETHDNSSSTDAVFLIDGYNKYILFDETGQGYMVGIGGTLTERFNVDGNVRIDGNVLAGGYVKQSGIFGEIWTDVEDQTVSNAAYQALAVFSVNGESSNTTVSSANDKITILKAGRYLVNLYGTVYCDYSEELQMCLILDGSADEKLRINQHLTAEKFESIGASAILNFPINTELQVGVRIAGATPRSIVFNYLNLNINYIGE